MAATGCAGPPAPAAARPAADAGASPDAPTGLDAADSLLDTFRPVGDADGPVADLGSTEAPNRTPDSAVDLTDASATPPADADAAADLPQDASTATAPDAAALDFDADLATSPDALDVQAGPDAAPDTAPPPPPGPIDPATLPLAAFTDITAALGIDPTAPHGICAAVADLDDNGREDLVVIERNGKLATIHATLLSGAAPVHVKTPVDTTLLLPTMSCTLVDLDGDVLPDLLVGGASGVGLYLGNGKGGFADKSEMWLPYIMDFSAWSMAPVDLDGDGDLDLFIGAGSPSLDASNPGIGPACGSQKCGYEGSDFACALVTKVPNSDDLQDRVFLRGADLPYVDATKQWQVPPGGLLSAALPIDIDVDGKMDVFVTDDFGGHRLLYNKGGVFDVQDTGIGFAPYAHGMGWGMGDFNSDGLPDLIMADVGPNSVYVQIKPTPGNPVEFEDQGGALGIWGPTWSASTWSPLVADFDLDGRDDVFTGSALNTTPAQLPAVTAGCTVAGKLPYGGHPNIDLLFLRQPQGGFAAQRFETGPHSHFMAISQALIDLDDDGDLDIVQSRPGPSLTSRIRVLRNDLAKGGGRVKLVLRGKKANRDALGAVVTAKVGGQLRTRWLSGSGGFGANRSRIAEFGVGVAGKATDVSVKWPDGTKTAVGELVAGTTKTLVWP